LKKNKKRFYRKRELSKQQKKETKELYKRKEWNDRLVKYKNKIDSGKFNVQDVPSFIEDYFNRDYKKRDEENKSIMELKNRLEKIRTILAKYYKCKEDEIWLSDFISWEHRGKINYKVIFGNADFFYIIHDEYTEDIQIIEGDADFSRSYIKSLKNIKSIRGNLDTRYTEIQTLGDNLQWIGGDALLSVKTETLGKVKKIGGCLNIRGCQIKDLGDLQSAGAVSAYCCGKEIHNLDELRRELPKRLEWYYRLKQYINKMTTGAFTVEDFPQFLEDYLKKKYYEGDSYNPDFKYIKNHIHYIENIIAKYYNCKEDEIYFQDKEFHGSLNDSYYKVVFGDVYFKNATWMTRGTCYNRGCKNIWRFIIRYSRSKNNNWRCLF